MAALGRRKIEILKTQIVFRDSVPSEGTWGAMSIRDGIGTVYGGRLGRGHTFADVPNHFVRDQLMDYIQTMLPYDVQAKAPKAIFDDISDANLVEYHKCIQSGGNRDETAERIYQKKPSLKNSGEARNLLKLEQAPEAIESENIDLTVRERVSYRDFDMVEPIFASCIKPNQNQTEEEKNLEISTSIDRDCDQVRAMIARLFKYSDEWTVDAFRKALGGEKRAALTKFLERKGPREGIKLRTCWEALEFFHRRSSLAYYCLARPCQRRARSEDASR